MWVDIFPRNVSYVPPPIDIAPRKPEEYVLQVVVWKTKDVIMHEENPYTHDIYVKRLVHVCEGENPHCLKS